MKYVLQFSSLLLVMGLLTSCEKVSFNSTLNVEQPFSIQGSFGKKMNLLAGERQANLVVSGERKIGLGVGDNSISFKLPKSAQLTGEDQSLLLSASELKQDFDLAISLKNKVSRGEVVSTHESCSEVIGHETVCETEDDQIVCTEENGRRICRNIEGETKCHEVDITRSGTQCVRYEMVRKQGFLSVDFKAPQAAKLLAHLDGVAPVTTQKHYTYVGECILH